MVEDITARTLPRDFARNPRIHNCWLLRTVTPEAQTKAGKPDRAQAGSGTAPESARRCDSEPTLPLGLVADTLPLQAEHQTRAKHLYR